MGKNALKWNDSKNIQKMLNAVNMEIKDTRDDSSNRIVEYNLFKCSVIQHTTVTYSHLTVATSLAFSKIRIFFFEDKGSQSSQCIAGI